MRYLLRISYDGTNYHGWQIQANAVSVQAVMNEALSIIFSRPMETLGCGRTDTGVHARIFYLHFDTDSLLDEKFIGHLNFLLPKDIRAYEVFLVNDDFSARFDAVSRSYEYHVHLIPNPFIYKYSLLLHKKPDFKLMNMAAENLLLHTIYTSFSKTGGDNKTDICKITEAEWKVSDNETGVFHISANRFLRGMVRAIVGTLLQLGYGKIDTDEFLAIIESKDRKRAGESVAPYALFLCNVKYPGITPH
jgi:tRNA pseudouridine38-40 synthase